METDVHKWMATLSVAGVMVWSGMAYYVTAEDKNIELLLQGQIDVLQQKQLVDEKVNQLVVEIDKKLTSIETSMAFQNELMQEVRDLRKKVNELQLELARRDK